ncbi:hypothetical protein C0Q70_03593 [Pomacea canaliculata]|uniref:Uncharacterized protein n=1 Tax=Pomacea canaliculata TaxID=400727 RepID=A0A2T7PT55_POMCA|nr:hypothetical protein C0Q70_03593 [Pomacea canaliculata]
MWAPLAPHVKLPAVCDSDLKDDTAQQGVLKCLQEFGQENGEAMFIISQLNFIDYLNKPCYTSAAAHLKYPRPEDLGPRFRRGEFDILLVHHHHGLVIGEIKSVGSNAVALNKTPDEMVADVAKKAARATRQLGEVQDGAEDLSRCLGDAQTTDISEVVKLCLCADDLAADDGGSWQPSHLEEWWTRRVVGDDDTSGTSQGMSERIYDDILARFAGPATTVTVHCTQRPRVEIRTLGEAVSELGERLSRLVVRRSRFSLILVLVALTWLRQGKDVFVLSLKRGSLAISRLIHGQLQMTLDAEESRSQKYGVPHLAEYDLFHDPAAYTTVSTPCQVFQSETLTVPLRCAPSVLEEVTKGIKNTFGVCGYSTGAVPSPFDGPNVIRLHHCSSSHLVRWPLDCEQCGHDIAAELKKLGHPVHDDVRDEAGQVTSRANGVIVGLRAAGIPTCAVQNAESACSTWRKDVLDAAVGRNDKVTVADRVDVGGLERKIVVWLSGRKEVFDDKITEHQLLVRGQIFRHVEVHHPAHRCGSFRFLNYLPSVRSLEKHGLPVCRWNM